MKTPIYKVKSCPFCRDYKGDPKPIPPEYQHLAKKMPDGSYKCLTCQEEEIQNMIKASKKRRGITS